MTAMPAPVHLCLSLENRKVCRVRGDFKGGDGALAADVPHCRRRWSGRGATIPRSTTTIEKTQRAGASHFKQRGHGPGV
jgi:hypothetical protein